MICNDLSSENILLNNLGYPCIKDYKSLTPNLEKIKNQ